VQGRTPRAARRRPSPDVLLLAATQLEYDVAADLAGVRRELEQRRKNVGEYIALDLGLRHCSTWLLRSKAGAIGPNSAAIRVSAAISELSPAPFAVIAVGIAYGLQRSSQHIGDLLVAEQLCLYEVERRGATRRITRGDRPSASGVLLDWFHSARADWPLASDTPKASWPRFHSGLVMTGEKLVDDPDFVDDLLAIEPEAIGGEMEGAGIYSAAVPKHTNWGVVKGICDWGYDKDSRYQEIAARNAFDFVYHALDQPVVTRALRRGSRGPGSQPKAKHRR
jgi:nucleoside phosphorylase